MNDRQLLRRLAVPYEQPQSHPLAQKSSLVITPDFVLLLSQLVTFAVVGALILISLATPERIFRSPDENANYIFTKALAKTGSLSYTADYLLTDEENLLHPRGAITYEGKAVPFNFLGLPILYAPFYRVLGDDLKYIAIPLAFVTVAALASSAARIVPDRPWVAWLTVLTAAPLLYAFSRPYMNILPALTFSSVACYFLVHYIQSSTHTLRNLILCSTSFALAAFMRYELSIFAPLVVIAAVLHREGGLGRQFIAHLAVFFCAMAAVFLIPVLILNYMLYDSPFQYGYGLFNQAYFSERVAFESSFAGLVSKARSILLPAYPFNIPMAIKSLVFQVGGVAPLFAMTSFTGLVLLIRKSSISRSMLFYGVVVSFYIFIYRGGGDSHLAGAITPNFEASVIRYSMPVVLLLIFLSVYAIAQLQRIEWTLLALGMLSFSSLSGLLYATDGNIVYVRDRLRDGETFLEKSLPHIEEEAIVFSDFYDKVISDRRTVASWWGGARAAHSEGHFRPQEVAASMKRLHKQQRPVYLVVGATDEVVPPLLEELDLVNLTLRQIDRLPLFKLEPVAVSAAVPTSVIGVEETLLIEASVFASEQDLKRVDLLVSPSYASGAAACWLVYRADLNRIYLRAGDSFLEAGPPEAGSTATNEYCSVDASRTTVTQTDQGLAISFAVAFSSRLSGSHNLYVRFQDRDTDAWSAPSDRGDLTIVGPAGASTR